MSILRRFTYTDKKTITALWVDQDNLRVWLGVKNGNKAQLIIQSAHNPNLRYNLIDLDADEIIDIKPHDSHVYLGLKGNNRFFARVIKDTPSTVTYYNKPPEVTNELKKIAIRENTYLFACTEGITTPIQVFRYVITNLNVYDYLDLDNSEQVNNLSAGDVDSTGRLWLCTYESPTRLVKINTDFDNYEINTLG